MLAPLTILLSTFKYKLKNFLLYAVIFLGVIFNSAQAALITNTYEASFSGVGVADAIVQWTVTFDNASVVFNQFLDGANGIAENGQGDDTIFDTQLNNDVDTLYATSAIEYDLSGFDALIDTSLATLMGVRLDNKNFNSAFLFERVVFPASALHLIFADAITLNARASAVLLNIAYDRGNGREFSTLRTQEGSSFSLISSVPIIPPVGVSEPAVALLLLTGLGLMGARRTNINSHA